MKIESRQYTLTVAICCPADEFARQADRLSVLLSRRFRLSFQRLLGWNL